MKRSKRTVRAAQEELGGVVRQKEGDQQIYAVPDPKTSFFTSRALSADIDSTVALDFRALAIAGHLVQFDITLAPDLFMDLKSMRLSFKGTIRNRKRNGESEPIPPTEDLELKQVAARRTFEVVSKAQGTDTYTVERRHDIVNFKRELLRGMTVTPAPLLPLTIWKNVDVSIGGTQLHNSSRDLFFLQVYLRTLLETQREPTKAQLKRSMFALDTTNSVIPGDTNDGLSARFELAGNSTSYFYIMPLIIDGLSGFRQGSLLPGGTNLRVVFEMGDGRHYLTARSSTNEVLTDKDYFMDIEDMMLHGRAYRLAAPVYNNFWTQLNRQELQYDNPAHIMDYTIIQKNNSTFRFHLPSSPCLPEKWVFCLLTSDQFAGKYDTNTFWLSPQDLKQIDVQLSDGTKKLELKFDMSSEHYNQAYFHFLEENNCDILLDTVALVPPELYKTGRYMFCLDLTRNHSYTSNNAIRSIPQASSCEIVLHFRDLFNSAAEVRAAFFKTPFRFVIVGLSGVGKTTFIAAYMRLLDTIHGSGYFSKVCYFYGVWNTGYVEFLSIVPDIEFVSGPPTNELNARVRDESEVEREPELWVIDDLMHSLKERKTNLDRLFTQLSHHQRISVILTSQMLYQTEGANLLKLVTTNSTALLVFKNFRDDRSLSVLTSQIFRHRPASFLADAVELLCKQLPYEPLAIALSTHFPDDNLRVCAGILPSPEHPSLRIFLPS